MSFNVSAMLLKLAKVHQKDVTFRGQKIPLERAFALDGGLPVLAKKANSLHDFLFGEKMQISFKLDSGALTGETIVIGEKQPLFVLVMMLYDVFEEMVVAAGKKTEVSFG